LKYFARKTLKLFCFQPNFLAFLTSSSTLSEAKIVRNLYQRPADSYCILSVATQWPAM